MSNYRSKSDRVDIVLNIVRQLKMFPNPNPHIKDTVDLYQDDYSYVTKLKQVFTNYIKQDDEHPETMKEYRGVVFLEETLKKDIEYILPIHKKKEPLFVIRMKNRN